jgi:APA family basic amino acid/polyamine antiporter
LDLTSMGTLFAFVLVCGGILKMQSDPNAPRGKFRTPYVNAKFILPIMMIIAIILVFTKGQEWKSQMLDFSSAATIAGNIPMWLFVILCLVLSYYSFTKNLSLIPVLGLIFCFYMMAQIHYVSWIGFVIWLVIGLGIYFSYGLYNSKLHKESMQTSV